MYFLFNGSEKKIICVKNQTNKKIEHAQMNHSK